ncbi:MAG: RNA polymerase sigma factor, partial [Eubacterium sp.]
MLGFYLALIDNPSDKETFSEIYNHYRDMMHQKAMSILHNRALAEEAVQESFLKIAKNISKISSPVCSKTAAFIVIIVRNTSYDILRTEKPNDSVPLDEDISVISNVEMPDIDKVFSKSGISFVLDIINEMDNKYRDALA